MPRTPPTEAAPAIEEARRAAAKMAEWQQRRDAAIVAALDAGASLRAVAEAVDLTGAGVAAIRDRA